MKIERNFDKKIVKAITGKEFKESGALWFINQTLHLFGMAITYNPDTDEIKPAIVKYRGFAGKSNDEGYKKLSEYLKDNINEFEKDCD
jgi:hypothetical protein